ncbi:retrotransposon protein, putative, ty1-copia subclass [Tanacetum coccineum]
MTTSVENNSVFRSFFEKQKLTGPNFIDWYKQLQLVLSTEDKEKYLEQPIPVAPIAANEWVKNQKEIVVMMLLTMDLEIQGNLAYLGANDMLIELKALYSKQVEHELLQTVRELHTCKQEEGQFVSSYVLKMKSYIDKLECLGHPVTVNLGVSLILVGLSKEYDSFVQNYNTHSMGKTVNELHAMLKLHEETLPKKVDAPTLHAIRAGKNPPPTKKDNPVKDAICHHCGEVGHWRRNCPTYLTELLKKKHLAQGASTSGSAGKDGLYEIEMSCSNTNDSSMYVVSNKRAKLNLDSSLLWHCRLGHISKKCIKMLQHDGLLNSIDIESLGKYVSCMSGKMARKPYSHQVESAKDLLGLIHTDEVENQLGKTIKSLRSDRGGEYMSQEFFDHLKEHGIIVHRTPPYMPQHNGVSERINRTLLDMVRSMMSQTTLPKSFWDYDLESAARILNMVPTKKVDKTPHEIWHGQAPKLSYLKNKVFVARNAEFFESNLIDQEASGSLEDLEIIQEEDINPSLDTSLNHEEDDQEIDEPQSDINSIRRSTRTRCPRDRLYLYIDTEEHELGDLGEPANYKAALLDLESEKWLAAMNVEMQSMKDNDVWELIELPPNAKTVGHKWIFKKKIDMYGAVHTFKSRLVVKGFTKTYGVDYEETFSPVVDIRAIRILIAISAFYDYEIWQMDVKTAFLNGYLFEEVYMTQHEGFVNPKYPNHVCKLKRSIYGLNAYIEKILKRYYMENSKRTTILMQEKLKLSKSDGASTSVEKQRMKHNKPIQQNPGELHWTTVKNILKYLRNTKDMFLIYGGDMKQDLRVSCYTDAGYLTDADDLKSQT